MAAAKLVMIDALLDGNGQPDMADYNHTPITCTQLIHFRSIPTKAEGF